MARRSASDERRATNAEHLRLALNQLIQEASENGRRVTALELCKRAQVSRNCLYESHRDIVHELGGLTKIHKSPETSSLQTRIQELTQRNAALDLAVRQLASQCATYYQAYSETRRKLERSEKTLASLRRDIADTERVRQIR